MTYTQKLWLNVKEMSFMFLLILMISGVLIIHELELFRGSKLMLVYGFITLLVYFKAMAQLHSFHANIVRN